VLLGCLYVNHGIGTKFSTRTPLSFVFICAAVPFYGCSTGSVWNEPKRVLNRDHHPFFDTTNGIQGTYYMIVHDVTNPSASFGAIYRQS